MVSTVGPVSKRYPPASTHAGPPTGASACAPRRSRRGPARRGEPRRTGRRGRLRRRRPSPSALPPGHVLGQLGEGLAGVVGDGRDVDGVEGLGGEAIDLVLQLGQRARGRPGRPGRPGRRASDIPARPTVDSTSRWAAVALAVAIASSGVGLPSRRSSPTGLPVTVSSPKARARRRGAGRRRPAGARRPTAPGPARPPARARRGGRRGAAAARRCTSRTCTGRSAAPPRRFRWPLAVPTMSRYCPMFSSMRSSFHTARAGRRGVVQELVGVHEGEVADQDGHALAEPPRLTEPAARLVAVGEGQMGRADAPSRRGAVHHVVVEQGERVEQLEGRAGVGRPRVVRVAAGPDEAPVDEGRAQALAAGQHQRLQRRVGRVELGIEGGPPGPLAVAGAP